MANIGDWVASVATPIARAVGAPCIDPETNELRPESGCAQRQRMLNEGRYADALFSLLGKKGKQTMRFRMSVEVEAETLEEALTKKGEAKVLSINPVAQPTQAPQPSAGTQRIPAPFPHPAP